MKPKRLTAAKFAQLCCDGGMPVAPGTVRRWARDGRLPHYRSVTGRMLFDPAVVERVVRPSAIRATKAKTA
jgi:hypothetical protein